MSTAPTHFPESIDELAKLVRDHPCLHIGNGSAYRMQSPELSETVNVRLNKLDKILSFSPADQLISVQSGILVSTLNRYLQESGFEIPIGLEEGDQNECIGDMIALNLPHWNMAKGGSWRDWVVMMRIVLANGEVVKSGSNVVKNVTGFDLHKLMIGARSTLGVIAEVTLRIRPIYEKDDYMPIQHVRGVLFRTNAQGLAVMSAYARPKDLENFHDDVVCYAVDPESGVVFADSLKNADADSEFDYREHGHVWRSNGEPPLAEFSEAEQKLMKRTKAIFDPSHKLNPGEFGFL